ncbi:MAG: hypothetical protein HUK12_08735 [Muribaculaceae bacterium]|nr:hypothetical protein [Muribaculaceae bacterium]
MIITKAQSKQLRYACCVVDYNQPCTRKYTGTPEGKLREIGRFKYIENGGELKSLTFDGSAVNLDGITFDVLLARVMECDALAPIQVAALPVPKSEPKTKPKSEPKSEPKKPSDIEDAVACTTAEPEVVAHLDAARGNDAHAVSAPVTVEAAAPAEQPFDDWCTPDNVSDWEEPDELEKIKQAEDRKKLEGKPETAPVEEPPKAEVPKADVPKVEHPPVTREEFENALRETAMNAAAREALRILNLECGFDDAATILRAMAKVPNFITTYGKCLEQVGTPHSLEEIAATLPDQEKWLRSLAINDWKIKD